MQPLPCRVIPKSPIYGHGHSLSLKKLTHRENNTDYFNSDGIFYTLPDEYYVNVTGTQRKHKIYTIYNVTKLVHTHIKYSLF